MLRLPQEDHPAPLGLQSTRARTSSECTAATAAGTSLSKSEKTEADVGVLPEIPGDLEIMMNLGNLESALTLGQPLGTASALPAGSS